MSLIEIALIYFFFPAKLHTIWSKVADSLVVLGVVLQTVPENVKLCIIYQTYSDLALDIVLYTL